MIQSNFEKLRRRKAFQEDRDLSLRQVAAETGLSFGTILRIKAENPDRVDCKTLDVLCDYFNCTVGQILERNPISSLLARIEKVIRHEGQLHKASEIEIRRYFTEDAIITLKGEKSWYGIKEVLDYYAAFKGTDHQDYEYDHEFHKVEPFQDNKVALVISRTRYRKPLEDNWNYFLFQIWKLKTSSSNPTGWQISHFYGGFNSINEANENYETLRLEVIE